MGDKQSNKVEGYKLDPQLKKMVKQYKSVTKMTEALRSGIAVKQSELQRMVKILYGTERLRDAMLQRMNPQEQIMEQEQPEPDLHINY